MVDDSPDAAAPSSPAERERQLRVILDAVPVIVTYADRNRILRYANRTLLEHFGLEERQLIGRHAATVVPPRSYVAAQGALDAVLAGQRSEVEFLGWHDRNMRLQFVPDIAADGTVQGYVTVGIDVTDERRLRAALIAEVHHRVKNLLQGVVGLLRAMPVESPEARRVVDTAVSQVMTLAIGFGLAAAHDGAVRVVDLVSEVVRYLGPLLGGRIELTVDPTIDPALGQPTQALDESAGVNLGLVINELVVNAWKHRAAGATAPLRVELVANGPALRLSVLSPGASLPAGFDFAAGRGLGTGLTLVRALLPTPGAALDLAATPAGVRSVLTLGPPLLRPAT